MSKKVLRNLFNGTAALGLLYLAAYYVNAIGTAKAFSSVTPRPSPTATVGAPVTPQPLPVPSPAPSPARPITGSLGALDVIALVPGSACAAYPFKSQGRAPSGYLNGMVLAFAKTYCRSQAPGASIAGIIGKDFGDTAHDALAYYGITDPTVAGRIVKTYALGIGMGMVESDGCYKCGRDTSAGTETASTAEAGPFQASYNSAGASTHLPLLWSEYKSDTAACELTLWQPGAQCGGSCGVVTNVGTGAGADWQAFTKSCPSFAAEWSMTLLRVLRAHFGTINRKTAEYRPECVSLLTEVKTLIDQKGCGGL